MKQTGTRPAQLAGTWYTGEPQALQDEITTYLQAAEAVELPKEIIALVAPHAGHRYSGTVAGCAYRAVQGRRFDRVAVISPFHHGHPKPLLTSAHTSYETPLGSIPVDQAGLASLETLLETQHQISLERLAFDQEHAIEIQLPFLQLALQGGFTLLPLMLSGIQADTAVSLGEALGELLAGTKSLLVASTDLSHFYPEEHANRLDHAMLDAIASLDPGRVLAAQRSGKGEACGLLAVVAVLTAATALGAHQCRVLKYATSGKTSGDYSRVVGYGAAVIGR